MTGALNNIYSSMLHYLTIEESSYSNIMKREIFTKQSNCILFDKLLKLVENLF